MWWVLIQWEGRANCSENLEQANSTVWATVKKGNTCAKPWKTKKRVLKYSKQKEEHMLFGVTVQWWEWLEFETITVFLVLKTNTWFAYFNHITYINSDFIYDFPWHLTLQDWTSAHFSQNYQAGKVCLIFPDLLFRCLSRDTFTSGLSVLSYSSNNQEPSLALPGQWPRFPVSVCSHWLPYQVLVCGSDSVQPFVKWLFIVQN